MTPAAFPIITLSSPVVTFAAVSAPTNVLAAPVVTSRPALKPTTVLPSAPF